MSFKLTSATLLVLVLASIGVPADKREERSSVPLPESRGVVTRPTSEASEFADALDNILHFCVFENGAHDLIYVGIKHGLWSQGEFDLSFKGKVVYTGKIEHLLFEGMIIEIGDVIPTIGDKNVDLEISRITGSFRLGSANAADLTVGVK